MIKKIEEILGKDLKTLTGEELSQAVQNEEFIKYLTDTDGATKELTNYMLENNKDPDVLKSFRVIKYQLDILDVDELFSSSENPEELSLEKIQDGTNIEKIYASLLVNNGDEYTPTLQKASEEITDIIEDIFDISNFQLVGEFLDILYLAQTEWHNKTKKDILENCSDRLIKIQEDFSNILNEELSKLAEGFPSDVSFQDDLANPEFFIEGDE